MPLLTDIWSTVFGFEEIWRHSQSTFQIQISIIRTVLSEF